MDRFPPLLEQVPGSDLTLAPAVEVLQRVFALLDSKSILYCVSHGYENLPDRWGSDIDILIDRAVSGDAIGELLTFHGQIIGARLVRRNDLYVILRCAPRHGIPQFLVLDFSHDVTCRNHVTGSGAAVLARRRRKGGVWVPAIGDAFEIQLARSILKGRPSVQVTNGLSALFAEDPDDAARALLRSWPRRLALELTEAAASNSWHGIVAKARALRHDLRMRNVVAAPANAVLRTLRAQAARARRFLQPQGLHVVMLGPDGAGKSSTIAALENGLKPLFARTEVRGFAPSLRQLLRRAPTSTSTPHALATRSWGTSLLRAIYWMAFAVVSHATLRIAKARSRLVLNDRHFIDILVDPVRYRYGGPRWALKIVEWLMPRPDLVILLDGRPEVLQARKKEITVETTARLCAEYLRLVSALPCGHIVDAEQRPEQVCGSAAVLIVEALHRT
ncbi:MAG: hypothetical protein KDK89_01985 [Alphaproteobacteria bacterium]|nr:hypothetical protein [Alphaproteobacteria bacterium]